SGKYDENSTYFGDDVRRAITRFSKENIRKNQKLLLLIEKYAALVGATKAQFSLSYIISKHQNAIPIPGMRKIERIQKNFDSCNISISEELLTKFEAELSSLVIYGNRTDEDIMKLKDLLAKEQ
ncbi:MAG: aldo/keto reductase, partial [Succinatimonas sp.]|nr:aldo/keto reductase [Succinatimonas sp.]